MVCHLLPFAKVGQKCKHEYMRTLFAFAAWIIPL